MRSVSSASSGSPRPDKRGIDQLPLGAAEQLAERAVDVDDPSFGAAVELGEGDADRRMFEGAAKAGVGRVARLPRSSQARPTS